MHRKNNKRRDRNDRGGGGSGGGGAAPPKRSRAALRATLSATSARVPSRVVHNGASAADLLSRTVEEYMSVAGTGDVALATARAAATAAARDATPAATATAAATAVARDSSSAPFVHPSRAQNVDSVVKARVKSLVSVGSNDYSMAVSGHVQAPLQFEGAGAFRARLMVCTLAGRSCDFNNIRVTDAAPGVVAHEVALLDLITKMSKGARVYISKTGTLVRYSPGVLVGGKIKGSFNCGLTRGVGYFLEALVALAPFAKAPLDIELRGVTNCEGDVSPDTLRTVTLPLLATFGIESGLELKILKRGSLPGGGGAVRFRCPVLRTLKPVTLTDTGKIRRIRGIAYGGKVSPDMLNRARAASSAIMRKAVADVYVFTDHYKGKEGGVSPGYGLTLVAEGEESRISAETVALPGEAPEKMAERCCARLLAAIEDGGAIDACAAPLVLLYAAICERDVSKVVIGRVTPFTRALLRLLRDILGVVFKITERRDDDGGGIECVCVGAGIQNLAKKVT